MVVQPGDFFDLGRAVPRAPDTLEKLCTERADVQGESSSGHMQCELALNVRPELQMDTFERDTLVFDTETSSLHVPVIVQIAYVLIKAGKCYFYDKILRRPRGVYMDKKATKIHGISKERSDAGAFPREELLKFHQLVSRVLSDGGVALAHNASFDVKAFNVTARKLQMPERLDVSQFTCTMRATKNLCNLRKSDGKRKSFFSNKELYVYARKEEPTWARLHNAHDDVLVTLLAYERLLRRKLIA